MAMRDAQSRGSIQPALLVMPVWAYLLTEEARHLPAHTVAEIVAATRVVYIALGGEVKSGP